MKNVLIPLLLVKTEADPDFGGHLLTLGDPHRPEDGTMCMRGFCHEQLLAAYAGKAVPRPDYCQVSSDGGCTCCPQCCSCGG